MPKRRLVVALAIGAGMVIGFPLTPHRAEAATRYHLVCRGGTSITFNFGIGTDSVGNPNGYSIGFYFTPHVGGPGGFSNLAPGECQWSTRGFTSSEYSAVDHDLGTAPRDFWFGMQAAGGNVWLGGMPGYMPSFFHVGGYRSGDPFEGTLLDSSTNWDIYVTVDAAGQKYNVASYARR